MDIHKAINEVLNQLCGDSLQRRMAALWNICEGTTIGQCLMRRIVTLVREDIRHRSLIMFACEAEYNRMRLAYKQWEIAVDGVMISQYATYQEGATEYQRLQRQMKGKRLSLHRIEASAGAQPEGQREVG